MPHARISEEDFHKLVGPKVGLLYSRALELFRKCGENLEPDITNVLMHAGNAGPEKTEEVLGLIEEHFEEHLKFQHPSLRGVVSSMGRNPTEALFLRIYTDVLKLEPTA